MHPAAGPSVQVPRAHEFARCSKARHTFESTSVELAYNRVSGGGANAHAEHTEKYILHARPVPPVELAYDLATTWPTQNAQKDTNTHTPKQRKPKMHLYIHSNHSTSTRTRALLFGRAYIPHYAHTRTTPLKTTQRTDQKSCMISPTPRKIGRVQSPKAQRSSWLAFSSADSSKMLTSGELPLPGVCL